MKRIVFLIITAAAMLASAAAKGQNVKLLSKKEKKQVLNSLLKNLNDAYIFPDVAKKLEGVIQQNMKKGAYNTINDPKLFADTLTYQLRIIMHDKHLGVRYHPDRPISDIRDTVAERQREENFMRFMKKVNLGFPKLDILEGNVGYLKIDSFGPVDKVGEICSAAMNYLTNTDALIIDLRDNHGGDPDMVRYLMSYFFGDKPVHINSLYYRVGNRTDDYWTIPVKGSKYLDKPVYVLTSGRTFSGGEELAYDFQTQKRGTIVGETTGGGANPGDEVALGNGFFAFIPNGRAVNPITKTNWEGTGVKPDITTVANNALNEAHRLALKTIIDKQPEQDRGYYRDALEKIQKK